MKIAKMVLFSLFLMGCSRPEMDNETISEPSERTGEIISAKLAETGEEAQSYAFDSSDESTIAIIDAMLASAAKMDGVVDMIDPNYRMDVEREEDEHKTYSIWWEKEAPGNLTLMDWVDTNTVYTLEGESAQQFEELIK